MASIPITIITGFLGSGKTTLILNLIPQLPPTYKLALLKNEFGDLAVDSQLASAQAISGVRELTNGCICCNLVGQLGDALAQLRNEVKPDRIIIETSGSAFPATLAMEINRLNRECGWYSIDGVISVIDVENWTGYEDKSYTAKLQAKYTDLIVFNKWEGAGERKFDVCLDRVGDLELDISWVKSDHGRVHKNVVLGIDGGLAQQLINAPKEHDHDHDHNHQSEVEVLSVTLSPPLTSKTPVGLDLSKFQSFLQVAPKDEIYRIKGLFYSTIPPTSSDGSKVDALTDGVDRPHRYILNWAYGRWTYWAMADSEPHKVDGIPNGDITAEPTLRMTFILAKYEANKWKKRLEENGIFALNVEEVKSELNVDRVL